MRKIFFTLGAVILAMLLVLQQGAWAGNLSSSWVAGYKTKSRLFVGGYDKEKKIIHLGWHLTLEDGWKTYWRSPGDAGLPPRWAWEESKNVATITVRWPMPELLHIFDLDTYVYKHEVILPIDVAVKDGADGALILLDLEFMICEEICVPQQANYRLDITALDDITISLFQKAQLDKFTEQVPVKISGDNVVVTARQNIMTIELPSDIMPTNTVNVDHIFVEGPKGILFGQATLKKDRSVEVPYKGEELFEGQEVTLTIGQAGGRGLELNSLIQK